MHDLTAAVVASNLVLVFKLDMSVTFDKVDLEFQLVRLDKTVEIRQDAIKSGPYYQYANYAMAWGLGSWDPGAFKLDMSVTFDTVDLEFQLVRPDKTFEIRQDALKSGPN